MRLSPAHADAPPFIHLLGEGDRSAYAALRSQLSSSSRSPRHKRIESFSEVLDAIKSYAVREADDDWQRCLVCGVAFLPEGIAVNIRQLSLLTGKCKSSINGSLQRMGYSVVAAPCAQLIDRFPELRGNRAELEQWSMRQLTAFTPPPEPTCAFGRVYEGGESADESFFDDELTLPLRDWIEEKDLG